MTNTLRAEIQQIAAAAERPLSMSELWAEHTRPTTYSSFTETVLQMARAQQLTRTKAPPGSGKGVKFVYGPGDAPVDDSCERGPTKREHKGFMQLKREREAAERGRGQ